jgi:hypothetical protein
MVIVAISVRIIVCKRRDVADDVSRAHRDGEYSFMRFLFRAIDSNKSCVYSWS